METLSTSQITSSQLNFTSDLASNHEKLQQILTNGSTNNWQINLSKTYLAPEYALIIQAIAQKKLQQGCQIDSLRLPELLCIQTKKH